LTVILSPNNQAQRRENDAETTKGYEVPIVAHIGIALMLSERALVIAACIIAAVRRVILTSAGRRPCHTLSKAASKERRSASPGVAKGCPNAKRAEPKPCPAP